MKSFLCKYWNLPIFSSWLLIQGTPLKKKKKKGTPLINPMVGRFCIWSYQHIPDPLLRADVSIPCLLEYLTPDYLGIHNPALLRRHPTAADWLVQAQFPAHAPVRNNAIRHSSSRASCRMMRSHHNSPPPWLLPFLEGISPKSFPQ